MWFYLFLFLVGIFAGFLNTLAGGGSILALPILILAGLPSPIANATNRVAILFQNMTGSYRFHKHRVLQIGPVIHIVLAAIFGAIIGSFLAVKLNSAVFDKILGIVFLALLILMLKPHKQKNRFTGKLPKWLEIIIFVIIGFYGGFIQVGIGFVFLATLNLIEEYSLVQANAVKVFIIMSYTIFAVIIFSIHHEIVWKYGLSLAAGNILGSIIGVKVAVTKGDKFIKIILAIAIIIASLKLFGVFG